MEIPKHETAESYVISAALQWPDDCLDNLLELTPEDFFGMTTGAAFSAIRNLADSNSPTDVIAITAHLREKGVLDKAGGPASFAELYAFAESPRMLSHWVGKCREYRHRRAMVALGTHLAQRASDTDTTVAACAKGLDDWLTSYHAVGGETGAPRLISAILPQVEGEILERVKAHEEGKTAGIQTGIQGYDDLTGGLHPSSLVIVAARPSCGKTSLAWQALTNVARQGFPVCMFSLETGATNLVQRGLGAASGVSVGRLRAGTVSKNRDVPKLAAGADDLRPLPIYISDQPMTADQIARHCARMREAHGVTVFCVDYLQLVNRSDRQSETEGVAKVVRALKAVTLELRITIVLLCQLNRDAEGARPKLTNLKQTGQIEESATEVVLMWQPSVVSGEDWRAEIGCILAKQKDGPTGEFRLDFLRDALIFEDRES